MGRAVDHRASRSAFAKNFQSNDDVDVLSSTIVGPPHFEKRRLVMLYSIVDEHSIANTIVQLLDLAHQSTAPITLLISSHGGSVDELRALYDVMKFVPVEIQTVGIGKICSAATLLLAAGAKGKRLISKSTRVMVHPVSIMGSGLEGNVFQVENQMDEMRRTQSMLVDMYVRETKKTREIIEGIMSLGHDHWMNADEAITFGLADKIIGAV